MTAPRTILARIKIVEQHLHLRPELAAELTPVLHQLRNELQKATTKENVPCLI